jgi:carboxyl-terminal processing protease
MKNLVVIFLFLVIGALVGGYFGTSAPDGTIAADGGGIEPQISHLMELIQRHAAGRPDQSELIHSSIRYLLRSLDPHCTYYNPDEFRRVLEENSGRYFGLGVSVRLLSRGSGRVMIIAPPQPGTPAAGAGLLAGDVIFRIDGQDVDEWDLSTVTDHLKGAPGTFVRVSIIRPGEEQPLDFRIRRAEIPDRTVPYSFCIRPNIGYVRLEHFSETTHGELTAAMRRLDFSRLDGLILDLRDNPGGLLVQAIKVAQEFLPKGAPIVSTRGRDPDDRQQFAAFEQGDLKVPLVVLINGQSASAAEIVASAIQDNDRGLVVGERSFGKGLVQTVYRLSDGSGLSLTTAKYYAPSGRCLQRPFGTSVYDYFRHRTLASDGEVRYTLSRREVYGGGGVMPDIPRSDSDLNRFQLMLRSRDVFFRFVGHARQGKVPSIPAELFENGDETHYIAVTPAVRDDFRRYIGEIGVPASTEDLACNEAYIDRGIRAEITTRVAGLTEGFRIRAEADEQIQAAVVAIPQARRLLLQTRRILAEMRRQQGKGPS